MNRILLSSSLPLCAAIIAAHEKGISNSEIFHLSNHLDQLERGSRLLLARPLDLQEKMINSGVRRHNVSALIGSNLTRGQIAYAITKHRKQQAAAKAIQQKSAKKKTKNIHASFKLPAAKTTVKNRTTISTSAADIQKRIKFSAPLKVVITNVASHC